MPENLDASDRFNLQIQMYPLWGNSGEKAAYVRDRARDTAVPGNIICTYGSTLLGSLLSSKVCSLHYAEGRCSDLLTLLALRLWHGGLALPGLSGNIS